MPGKGGVVAFIVAFIRGFACDANVTDATKRIFRLTGLRPEVNGMTPRGLTYETFDDTVNAAT